MPISEYFPLAGGLAALLGVAVTLYFTGRRDRAKQDRERIDATRTELRKEAAELLTALYEFGVSVGNLGTQIDRGEAAADAMEAHEAITLRVRTFSMRVRLLTDDDRLIKPIEEVILAHEAVNDGMAEQETREVARQRFEKATNGMLDALYTVAVPTDVIKARRKAVSWRDRRRWASEERVRRRELRAIFEKKERDR
ncbi:hypothetical protein [Pseudonocardia endophytica]|uniref:Uncharacterized protein n=1 Tax=Pseudonocardia endophytica TaxID=401976 RepID=A0A4R1HT88_PSEEN|nr:hypothetical protein [Pseudonocardia endophytica]TCK20622.1 hypothetical protein EV378_4583 [Pseudonocardia endophytica]